MPAHEANKVVTLEHPSGATAKISLFGATVISWIVKDTERLFVSKKAILDGTKAIRGGIPLVFPIFGTKSHIPLPQHGFARNSYWDYLGILTDNDEVAVRFALKDNQLTKEQRQSWPHSFRLVYTVTLTANTLKTILTVKNEDSDTLEFNTLLHTYFRVKDIANVSVEGLNSYTFTDKVTGGTTDVENRDKVTIAGEVDRVYQDVKDHLIVNVGDQEKLTIDKTTMKDTVVWNPWIEKAKGMGDFDDNEYHEMICVEVGSVAKWVRLESGQTWTGGQTISIV
ncbi:galactose mutarotase-like domain-containing protein [Halteromyces radiatus]|uniref:galactose mutarotase-like domain-containing protein n=1 Tax=Halteromyces radiatus TaxID=101107 RepID=UPI002220C1BC|nr:galactose mutarotase-like domain-containing protein [Halteromyces radiatus]KAI8083007.1 galactose mutarotase-like domain-containing protein [Halteromyces radiatus]